MSVRAATRKGRHAALPSGAYEPDDLVQDTPAGAEVLFEGEDGRRRLFRFTGLPIVGLHPALAAGFAAATGPAGSRRTRSSAEHLWGTVVRLLKFLDKLPMPPRALSQLTAEHLEGFYRERLIRLANPRTAGGDVSGVRTVLMQVRPTAQLRDDALIWLEQRRGTRRRVDVDGGYSDREFTAIMAAARSDVAELRRRLRTGWALADAYRRDPGSVAAEQSSLAARLADIATTGKVPLIRMAAAHGLADRAAMIGLAQHLFVVERDLTPMLVLAVGLSGRNAETIKDLSAEHTVLEQRAVRVQLTKRRRGPSRTFETVHWEVGRPSAQLRTPGGLYLLFEMLMGPGRSFSGTDSLWSIWVWRNGHVGPFDRALARGAGTQTWATSHGLVGDDGMLLRINLPRLKKTVDVRTTRAIGGHLPSSTRSNSMQVLFTHYLRGDASVREWGADVVTGALVDAEHNAVQAHARVLATAGDVEDPSNVAAGLNISIDQAQRLIDGDLNTAFAACQDIEHNPVDNKRCNLSFLLCLSCPNALVTPAHIPALKGLLGWLSEQRERLAEEIWWQRFGLTWFAITQHIRPKFTPAEWETAPVDPDVEELLDVLDGPREQA
ncbi:hypothetical protein [Micromonospora sp. RV43]|uniref:hypothetical protein n=1 Tax=Micromonospora sp. RV43 TaxID=1661387 RepID=UPI00064C0D9B|nr:hypothetical protein [Micromonospora sp. RV43]